MNKNVPFCSNIWYGYRYGGHALINLYCQNSLLASNIKSIQTSLRKIIKVRGGGGIWNFCPCIIRDELADLQLPQRVSNAITSLCFLFCCLSLCGLCCEIAGHQQLQVHPNLVVEWKELNSDWFSWGHMLIIESIPMTRGKWPSCNGENPRGHSKEHDW